LFVCWQHCVKVTEPVLTKAGGKMHISHRRNH